MFSRARRTTGTDLVLAAGPERRKPQPSGAPSIIAAGVRITGNIRSDGEIHVDGRIDGDIDAFALTVGEQGHVVGHVSVEDAVIHGIVSGSIRGRRVRLARSSKVIAEITHDILSIDEGASFEGQCRRVSLDEEPGTVLRIA
ncbi:MAG TPA: polymer-forming cytoskeletal protein [Geminicoccaceae bacterium]|nr:polymer-forming cytoskeletal protein [Geminicoccus sp.]HMU51140.1 polymer-forming cytoskeletal protein [Geminicoccaceae bacterium]